MTRRIARGVDVAAELAASSMSEMLAGRTSRRRDRGSPGPAALAAKMAEVRRRVAGDDWGDARPETLVVLYFWCHEETYGVAPHELLKPQAWHRALLMAGALVRSKFDGDRAAAVDFVRWTWRREGEKVARVRSNGGGLRRRVGYYDQFAGGWLLTDYLASTAGDRGHRGRG